MAEAPSSAKAPKKPKKPQANTAISKAVQDAFNRYLGYLGYFNPGSKQSTWRDMNRLFPAGQLGPQYTPAQLRNQAQTALKQIFNPRVQQIQNTFRRQMETGGRNIAGFTGTYADRLGQIPVAIANANQQGMQQQAAVGGALADYMRNTGAEISSDLQNRLADANLSQGQIEGTVGNAAQTGFLGSGEVAGLNASSLMRMAEEGNAWLNWGNALPGIGILQGQQELGKFQGQLNEGFLQQMGDLQSQMAEMGVSLYQNMLDRDLQRRQLGLDRNIARSSLYGDSEQRRLNAALGGAGLLQNWAQMLLERELGLAGLDLERYGIDADIYGTDVSSANAAADRAAEAPNAPAQRQEAWSALISDGVGTFPAAGDIDEIQPGVQPPSIHNMRKRVMTWLRGRAKPYGFSEQELRQIRDQILATLGYSERRRPAQSEPPATGPTNPGGDQPGEVDPGGDFPWYPGPLIPPFFDW